MSEPQGFDLDGETDRAWSAFTRRLADRLADLAPGESLTLGLGDTTDDTEPGMARVLFALQSDGMLRSTEFSADDEVGSELVTRQREADQLATETVRLLRDAHAVMHPAFLSVVGESYELGAEGQPWEFGELGPPAGGEDAPSDLSASDQLLELAFAAITDDLGREPIRDVDGDLVIEYGSTRVFVRVLEGAPVIQLFSRLVHNITHPLSAPAVVAMLNNDYPFVKFLFADDAVLASAHVPGIPFVPAQLKHMLAIFSELADDLDDELARRLGGEREADGVAATEEVELEPPDGVPPELMVLVRMDPDGHGLDPKRTAEVCGFDRALTRQLLHIAVGQEEVWNEAIKASADDPEEEARCLEEATGWEATRRSLAGALDLIDSLQG